MAEWRLDPDTFKLIEEGRPDPRGYTWDKFQAVERPPCPVCSTPINVDAVRSKAFGDPEPMYIPGRMSCPNGCDPHQSASRRADEEASHREYSFISQRTIIDRATGQPVKVGRGGCTCGWTTNGREDECMRQYAEHVATHSQDE